MDPYGLLWIPMISYGFLGSPTDYYGLVASHLDSYGFLWAPAAAGIIIYLLGYRCGITRSVRMGCVIRSSARDNYLCSGITVRDNAVGADGVRYPIVGAHQDGRKSQITSVISNRGSPSKV